MGAQLCNPSRGETGGVQAPRDADAADAEDEMSSKEEDSPEPGPSAASTSLEAQGGGGGGGGEGEDAACPACRDIDTTCSSSCRHCFCPLCLWDWSLGPAACPRCRRPTRHTYPQHVALYHEVQDRVYDGKRRRSGLSEQRAWSRPGHSPQRGRRRSLSGHRWWAQGSSSSGRRRMRRRRRRRRCRRGRNWDNVPDEGQVPRPEWDTSSSSWGRQSRRGSRAPPSRDQQEQPRARRRQRRRNRNRERSHGWDREWSRSRRQSRDSATQSQGTESHDDFARQRHCRSRNAGGGRAPRHQRDIPDSSGRSRYRCRTWSPGGHRNQ